MASGADLSAALRRAVASGDWEPVRARMRPDAVLRTSTQTGRWRLDGADAVLEHLTAPGPGEVGTWTAQEWPAGVAVTFEWAGPNSTDRRRWYVRTAPDGRIAELWSATARPFGGADDHPEPPAALLERLAITEVEPLSHAGNSGAALLRATGGGRTFVLKHVTPGGDWLARATRDDGRAVRLHAAGAFDAMPAQLDHAIEAVERTPDGAWMAMRDVHANLLGDGVRLTREQSRRVLGAAAALHAAFHGAVPDGAATLSDRIGIPSPAVVEAERATPDLLPKQFEHGWEAFADVVAADVAGPVLALVADTDRLAGALLAAHGGATLIHGDLRDDNLGFDGERVVLIDWDLATAGTPTVEFAWYLAQDAWRIDAGHDEIEADHRAAHGGALSDDEVELGMLSGLVQYGWLLAHSARVHPDPSETAWGREEIGWWVPRVRRALERLGGGP
jgi:aminoglycoside phosphotransferase (APT) family kinase protein